MAKSPIMVTSLATFLLLFSPLLSLTSAISDETLSLPSMRLLQGESYKLECPKEEMEGTNRLVDWYHNQERIIGQYERYTVTEKGVLHIRNAQLEDSGNFTCTALNGFRSISFTISLLVVSGNGDSVTQDPPIPQSGHPDGPVFLETGKMRPAVIEQALSKNVELFCRAMGNPMPNITWFRNELPIAASRSIGGRATASAKVIARGLRLSDLSVADSGRYTCRARNTHGEIEYTYTVIVKANNQLIPSFTNESSSSLLVPINEYITLRCDTRSEATPTISWFKRCLRANSSSTVTDGTVLSPDGFVLGSELPSSVADLNNDIYVYKRILADGTRYDTTTKVYQSRLPIERVTLRDAGLYLCLAKNEHGTNTLQIYLRVIQENGTIVSDDSTPVVVTIVPRSPPQPAQQTIEILPSDGLLQSTSRPAPSGAEQQYVPSDSVNDSGDVHDQSNFMLIVYILAPLLIIVVSLVIVIYYVRTRESTKRKRLRAAANVYSHHSGGAKSASNSSASLSTRNGATAGAQNGNVMQLTSLNGAAKAKREYVGVGNTQQAVLSSRPSGYSPITPHGMSAWPNTAPPTVVSPTVVAEAQTMLPLCLPQYECNANHATAAQFDYFQNGQAKPAVHHYANGNCAGPCSYEYPVAAPIATNGYMLSAPMYSTNMNTMSTQPSTAYNTHSHNAQSSASASYTSIRVSPS